MTNVKITLKRLPCLLLALVILSTAFILTGCNEISIDVKGNYLLDISFSGCDGHGKVEFGVNNENVGYALKSYLDNEDYYKIYSLVSDITFKMEDESLNGNLKNGDTFKVVAEYDEKQAENLNVTLTNTEISCTVADLPEGVELDAFAKVKVEFSGTNGSGYARINTESCPKTVTNNVYFDFDDDNSDLSNGDKITVIVKAYGDLEEKGYFLKEESKEFTVEGLSGPRTSLEGVDLTSIAKDMKDEADDETDGNFDLAYLDYKFESGKTRDLSYSNFDYTAKLELVKYVYAYDAEDLDDNGLVAIYKLTNKIKRTGSDQSYVSDGATAMKKGDTDTGITYIIVSSPALTITADNKVEDDYMYYSTANYADLNDVNQKFVDGGYTTVDYDKDFKEIGAADDSSASSATEKSTEKTDSKQASSATEKATADNSASSSSAADTEKATTKQA